MAKLGDYEFPEVGLTESVELTRRIYDKLNGKVRRDALAIILEMSPAGGAFATRASALRIWKLTTGGSHIELTPAGIQVSSPTSPEDETQVMRRLAESVPLFNELHERIGDSSVDQSVLAAMIQEITTVEMEEVVRRVAMIERIFQGIRGYLSATDDHEAEKTAVSQFHTPAGDTEALPVGWMEFRYDDGALRMRETPANLDMLITTLESRRNQLSD